MILSLDGDILHSSIQFLKFVLVKENPLEFSAQIIALY
jgi:hypothetical protein